MHSSAPLPLRSARASGLTGRIRVPGDKSMSHRALMFGAVAIGETVIRGLLEAEDVINTARAMTALGAAAARGSDGVWRVQGVGVAGLTSPAAALDFGNSGTGVRLAMGLMATTPLTARCVGDASLSRRPMGRVTTPLAQFGARFETAEGGRLPLTLHGARNPVPITYTLPVASAQVKSAVLLAGLNTPGITTVIEPTPTRDHTERMLKGFGAKIAVTRSRRCPPYRARRPARAEGASARRAGRSVVRRLSDGGGAHHRGLGHRHREHHAEPHAHRPHRHAHRDGRRHRDREPQAGRRRGGWRPPCAPRAPARACACRRRARRR